MPHHDETARPACDIEDAVGIGQGGRDRLFDQHIGTAS
jgi:hypothetical protein